MGSGQFVRSGKSNQKSASLRFDRAGESLNDAPMSDIIYPRSSREIMDGWMHLPRYVDKIRLHLAGKLHPDYHANFGKGFDAMWLKAAGVTHDQMIEVVKKSFIDGQVCDWVRANVKRSAAEKRAHAESTLNRPATDDAAAQEFQTSPEYQEIAVDRKAGADAIVLTVRSFR